MSTTGARKLATIAALDAAGYSRQSEVDEAAAVREVSALATRVRASAAAHGGRVFNTGGDGFMLEFPSASGAAAFAEEVSSNSRLPVRIGLHLGEVIETPEGDLLGRGVNVAARLQTIASPGEIAMSGEVRKALGQPWIDRLEARGEVKLDKMDERVDLFILRSPWRAHSKLARIPKRTMLILAGIAALGLAVVAAALTLPGALRPRSERVAVLQFEAIGDDPALFSFTRGLADQIVAVMSTSELQTTASANNARFRGDQLPQAAREAGVGFVLDGTVREEAGALRVNMHVIDARQNVALWSNTYARADNEAGALQEQVAAHAAGVLRCALVSRRPEADAIDAETLSIFLRACNRVANFDRPAEEMVENARQVTERAPRFSRGWSMLALASAFASRAAASPRAEELRELSRQAAERARSLDGRNAESYLALSAILPQLGHWNERQELISRALRLEPDSADALMLQGELLAEVGRMEEALAYFRRGVALDPLSPSYSSILISGLFTTNNLLEAQQIQRRLDRVWPDSPSSWYNKFTGAMILGDPQIALAMLDDADAAPYSMDDALRRALRNFITARRDRDDVRMRAAVQELAAFARRRPTELPRVAVLATVGGDLDQAFALARLHFSGTPTDLPIEQPIAGAGRYFVFMPGARGMRYDRRFMALARDVGWTAHWIETGRWPDFCSEPDLPYDCQEEARRT